MISQIGGHHNSRRIEELKRLIDDEAYLSNAVRRIAQVLSDEILGEPIPGALHERKRKIRR